MLGLEGILGAGGFEGTAGLGLPTTEAGREEAGVEAPEPPLRAWMA